MGKRSNSLLRQRNELVFLGNNRKPTGFPVLFGLFIRSLLEETKFHQIWRGPSSASPPRNIIRGPDGFDGDAVARPEDQQARTLMTLVRDLDLAVDQIDPRSS